MLSENMINTEKTRYSIYLRKWALGIGKMSRLFRPKKYFKPGTVGEAVSLLSELGEGAKIIAGGTDLLVEKPPEVDSLVDITSLPLDYIEDDGKCLRIGALTTLETILESDMLVGPYVVIAEAASRFGHRNARNLATVGGNLCSSVPSADMAPPLIVLDSNVRIASPGGERVVPIDVFFVSVRKNVINEDELLVEVQVPAQPPRTGTAFSKIGRTSVDIAIVNASVRLSLGEDDTCDDAKIALGSVAPTPIRAVEAEGLLRGKEIHDELIEKAAMTAAEETKPISDVRSSAEYRREASGILVGRCVRNALERTWEA
jgi:carbon-monoxide dehydrogenase medium subunit